MRSVLHVLPHPGGGGETYVDTLSQMEGYRFERFYLAPSRRPAEAMRRLPRTALTVTAVARKHDLVHVQGEVASGLCLPTLALRPSIVTFNGLHLLRRVSGLRASAARANVHLVVRSSARTICVSEAERDEVAAVVGAAVAERIVLIHNAVDLPPPVDSVERAAARASLNVADGITVAAWLAGLDSVKDPLTAVKAALEVARSGTPFVLLIAGEGPLRADIERVVAASGADGVRLLGFRRDVRQILAAADLFVLSSQREGLSFSLLEAMALGRPVVVSDAPGNRDAVGDAGVIVPCGDVSGFVAAFAQLRSDVRLRADLGEAARRRVAQLFTAEEMTRRTRDLYDMVIDERRR